jgi:hypothetical protein
MQTLYEERFDNGETENCPITFVSGITEKQEIRPR